MKSTFKFQPFSEKQKKVLRWWDMPQTMEANGIIADGAIRSGKTTSMSLSYCLWAMTCFDGQNFLMSGKTISSFRRNVLKDLKKMLISDGYKVDEKRGENLVIISKGGKQNSFYLFGGKDEGAQDLVQGITAAGAFFDEVALMPESFVNQATARCSVDGAKFWFNCNPSGPRHWFKVDWIDKRRDRKLIYLHFTMDDNLSLSTKIKERYYAQYTGVFFRRYILGEWCIAEGVVYPFFNRSIHAISDYDPRGRYYISIDYGTHNPFAMGLWRVRDHKAVMMKEYYYDSKRTQRQKTDEEYYADIEAFAGALPIERIIIDPSAASMKTTIFRHGKFSVLDADNQVIEGIGTVASLLHSGYLFFDKSCVNTFAEFESYSWKDGAANDTVIKENDHMMDSIRYFCMAVMWREIR